MGVYRHIRDSWNKPSAETTKLWRERLIKWRREQVTVRLEHPTRLDRARSIGYKAKPGFIVVRQRVLRGGHTRPKFKAGRAPRKYRRYLSLRKNYQFIAEERAQDHYPNCLVLNSYYVAKDGKHYWYEVVLVDPAHPVIRADPNINWVVQKKHQSRVYRGKTSAGRKVRGLRNKGKGAEKARPSRRANKRLY